MIILAMGLNVSGTDQGGYADNSQMDIVFQKFVQIFAKHLSHATNWNSKFQQAGLLVTRERQMYK